MSLSFRGKPQGDSYSSKVFYVMKANKPPNAQFSNLAVAAYRETSYIAPFHYLLQLYNIQISGHFSNIFIGAKTGELERFFGFL